MKLNELTIQKAHEGLIKKEFSCKELTQECLNAIDKNKDLNAFITIVPELALKKANEVDEIIKTEKIIHPLCGIPFSVKDALCTKDIRSTAGALILDNYIPPYTATTIQKLLDKNGIILGKNNCDAFGHGASNENSSYGHVKNPCDLTRVAGGSSGGSGATVASHMGIYSIGEDTGGSVRCPASFCGVVGLKVSYGRNSRYGAMPMASSLDTVGPIGKTVYDVALLEEVLAGHDVNDPTTTHDPVLEYSRCLDKDISGLTCGVPREYFAEGLDNDIRDAIECAIQKAKSLGVKIREVSLPMTKYAVATYYIIVPSEDSSNLARIDGIRYGVRDASGKNLFDTYTYSRAKGFPDEVKRRIMIGTYALSSGYYDDYYLKAQKVRTLIKQDFERVFREVNFLLTPTLPMTAFGIGEKVDDPLQMYLCDAFLVPASVAGIPALSIPCGHDSKNLPIGLQIIAPYMHEDIVLNVGYKMEKLLNYINVCK